MSLNLDMTAKLWLSALPKGINKLVLLCFCQHLNDTSALSWPSISRVARMCGMSERTVQCHVRALQRAGILLARLRIGRTTQYSIDLRALAPLQFATAPDLFEPADNANPAVFAADGADSGTPPPQIAASTPANPAPITAFNSEKNIKGTAAPALPDTVMMIDGVNPQTLADFAAIRKTKRKGAVTAAVIEEICQQAHLAGMTLQQALTKCVKAKWARFEAAWLERSAQAENRFGGGGRPICAWETTPMPASALWKPPVSTPASPEIRAAEQQRQRQIRQTPPEPVTGPGWAHRIVQRHQSGERVSHAVLRDACLALKIAPASLSAARLH